MWNNIIASAQLGLIFELDLFGAYTTRQSKFLIIALYLSQNLTKKGHRWIIYAQRLIFRKPIINIFKMNKIFFPAWS